MELNSENAQRQRSFEEIKQRKINEIQDVIKIDEHEIKLIFETIANLGQKRTSKAASLVDIRENTYITRDNYWPYSLRKVTDFTGILNPFLGVNENTVNLPAFRLRGGADNAKECNPEMVNVAIENAAGHGISLHQGVPNLGNGNCIFESVMDNISTRQCFNEVFDREPDYYLKIWLDEAENLVYTFCGGGGRSEKQFRKDWAILKCSGAYEYDLGDYVLPAVAHCTRKDILIFDGKLTGTMDPIYVVEASFIGGRKADTDIPVLLAYNGVHYEGLVPDTDEDIAKTVSLKDEFIGNKYNLKRKDIPIFSMNMSPNTRNLKNKQLTYAQALINRPACATRSSANEALKKIKVSIKKSTKSSSSYVTDKNEQQIQATLEENVRDMGKSEKLCTKKDVVSVDSENILLKIKELQKIKTNKRTEEEKKELDRLRKTLRRSTETADKQSVRLEKQRKRQSVSRASESIKEKSIRLDKDRKRHCVSRASETIEGKNRRLDKDKERHCLSRASEKIEGKNMRLNKDKERHCLSRASEKIEGKNMRLKKDKERHCLSRASETIEKRQERQERDNRRHLANKYIQSKNNEYKGWSKPGEIKQIEQAQIGDMSESCVSLCFLGKLKRKI